MEFYINGVICSFIFTTFLFIFSYLIVLKNTNLLKNVNAHLGTLNLHISPPLEEEEEDANKFYISLAGRKFKTSLTLNNFYSDKFSKIYPSLIFIIFSSWLGVLFGTYIVFHFFTQDKSSVRKLKSLSNIHTRDIGELKTILSNDVELFLKIYEITSKDKNIKRRYIFKKQIDESLSIKNEELSDFYVRGGWDSKDCMGDWYKYQYYFEENKLLHKLFHYYGEFPGCTIDVEEPIIDNHFVSELERRRRSDLEPLLTWHEESDWNVKYFLMFNRYDLISSDALEKFYNLEMKRLNHGYGQIIKEIKELNCIRENDEYWILPNGASQEKILTFEKLRSNKLIKDASITYREFENYEEIIKAITEYMVLIKQ